MLVCNIHLPQFSTSIHPHALGRIGNAVRKTRHSASKRSCSKAALSRMFFTIHRSVLHTHFVLVTAVFIASACSEPSVDLEAITKAPAPIMVSTDLVTLPIGIAVAVRVRTDAVADENQSGPYISMKSADPSVVTVWPTTQENVFVLGAAKQGTAAVNVRIQEQKSHTFTATIVAPSDDSSFAPLLSDSGETP